MNRHPNPHPDAEQARAGAHGLGAVRAALCALFCVGAINFWGAPARAQVSGVLAVQNDDRFRGRSVSEGEPVAIASIQYDLESGVSIGASAVGTTNGAGADSDSELNAGLLRASGHIGYARSLGRNLAVDGGVVVQTYTDRYSSGRSQTFVEIFGGVTFGPVALHASYSPSYLDAGLETLYVEVNAVQELGSGFRATARAGLLNRLSGEGSLGGENTRWDAQIGLTKDFDRLTLYANVGTAGSGQGTYFDGPWQGRDAVVVGISRSF